MNFSEYFNNLNENIEQIIVPRFLYHATYAPLYKSILKYGIGGKKTRKNWDDSISGIIYLSDDKDVAESYAEASDMVPEDWLDEIITLKIDTTNLDKTLFKKDRNNLNGDTFEYHGKIFSKDFMIIKN